MTTTDRPLEPFEERRLAELKAFVAARADAAPSRRPRAALAASAAALTLAASAAVALATSGGPAAQAYAIERKPDGVVYVRIRDGVDAGALTRQLERLGVPARVYSVPEGEVCHQPHVALVDDVPRGLYGLPGGGVEGHRAAAGEMVIRMDTRLFRPGQYLLFGLKKQHGTWFNVSQYLVTGRVEPCRFVPAPPARTLPTEDGQEVVLVEPSIVVP
ncbi:hypothetical protein BTM25_02720 [Actinomadura rubteroloni]|uniref:Uncharacterized protein n=1 Tax=Actinomadura rubteroloni TaxID=1926885 RepID=A0A2P4ULL3_9ACTN|nr:hypothetical protein [Actinomadura rubteroloni]POM25889.1 hypothetical protein BTM25_02720 [Actinomadura rubteroloni]